MRRSDQQNHRCSRQGEDRFRRRWDMFHHTSRPEDHRRSRCDYQRNRYRFGNWADIWCENFQSRGLWTFRRIAEEKTLTLSHIQSRWKICYSVDEPFQNRTSHQSSHQRHRWNRQNSSQKGVNSNISFQSKKGVLGRLFYSD